MNSEKLFLIHLHLAVTLFGFLLVSYTLLYELISRPMDTLAKSDRISYVCAMGATTNEVCDFFVRPPDYEGSIVMKTGIIIIAVLMIGLMYFPVFATLTTGSLLSFRLGSLYIWMLTLAELVKLITWTGCEISLATKAQIVFLRLPSLLCLLFLSVRIPYRMYQDYSCSCSKDCLMMRRHKRYTLKGLKRSDMGLHVRSLLGIKENNTSSESSSELSLMVMESSVGLKAKIFDFFLDNTYRPHQNFRYSTRFLYTQFVAFLLLYKVPVIFYIFIIHFYESYHERASEVPKPLEYLLNSLITTVTLSFLLGVFGIMRMFTTYRETMFALNREEMKDLLKNTPNNYVLFYAMRYSGAQVISVFWGFVIHIVILLLPCAVVSFTLLALREEYSIYTRWLVSLVQKLVRVFFITSYFIFFYNLFVGIFISLFRIIKSMAVGAMFLPRLDTNIMPKDFTSHDKGYMTFLGFMKLENDYTHRVMLTFIHLLQILAKESYDAPNGSHGDEVDVSRRHKVVAFKWQILISLANNPGICKYRKIKMAR